VADRIVIVESRYGYSLQWYLEEDGDLGLTLGEGETHESLSKMDKAITRRGTVGEDPDGKVEHAVTTLAAWKHEGMHLAPQGQGFYWESKKGAAEALRLVKVAIKELKDNKPWPEWAKQAAANGWKPPKGWKP
jgi:hypothetical protein